MIRSGIETTPRRSALTWLTQLCHTFRAFVLQSSSHNLLRRPQWLQVKKQVTIELGEVLDHFAEGYLIVDSRFKIVFANSVICEILDVPRNRLERRCIDSLKWSSCVAGNRPWHGSQTGGSVTESRRNSDPITAGDEQLMAFERHDRSRRLLAITVREMASVQRAGTKVISLRDATGVETYRAEMENLLARVRRSREEIQESNKHLTQLVAQDALTGCRNRRSLDEQSVVAWDVSEREGENLACMMFDIDHFKSVNDKHGHASGDEVLRRFGQSLRETFAGVGHVYRYGGEEFCVLLLPNHNLSEAQELAERVRVGVSQIEVHCSSSGEVIPVTVSIGVADQNAGATDAAGMIDQADKCLYMAKRSGRNVVVSYDSGVASARFRNSSH